MHTLHMHVGRGCLNRVTRGVECTSIRRVFFLFLVLSSGPIRVEKWKKDAKLDDTSFPSDKCLAEVQAMKVGK